VELLEGEEELIYSEVDSIFQELTPERENLIPVLQETQKRLKYLPKLAMQKIAEKIGIPEVDVYSVATFYNQFRLYPPGKNQIKVCMGTACHMMGGHIILESFERRLGIKEGETTPDREFSLERVACVGCCALAPVVVVNEKVEPKVSPIRVDGILLSYEIEKKLAEKEKEDVEEEGKSQ
jgi:NADH-quinone oxidoreductase subunit E